MLKQYMNQHKGPFLKAVKVKVVKFKQIYMSRQIPLADVTSLIRAIVSSDSPHLKENESVVLRNCTIGRNVLIINKSTKESTTSQLTITDLIAEVPKNLIDPATALTKSISIINEDTPLTTIEGIIEHVYLNRTHII